MENIGRSKNNAVGNFTQFQDEFYNIDGKMYFDAQQCSPTKRLVQMKNATSKHHVIEAKKGIKDQHYHIQYTTCPDKSYVIKPDKGEIKYEAYTKKQTHQLVNKILNGTVKEVSLAESAKNPKRRLKADSPVRIKEKHCKRAQLGIPLLKTSKTQGELKKAEKIEKVDEPEVLSVEGNINIMTTNDGCLMSEEDQEGQQVTVAAGSAE